MKQKCIPLCVLLIAFVVQLLVFLYKQIPEYDRVIQLKGVQQKIQILRDEYATPHIQAENENDGYFATGYIHAQDRLWQIHFVRMLSNASLSNIAKNDQELIEFDKFIETVQVRENAEKLCNEVYKHEQANQLLQSYARGVNAYVNEL